MPFRISHLPSVTCGHTTSPIFQLDLIFAPPLYSQQYRLSQSVFDSHATQLDQNILEPCDDTGFFLAFSNCDSLSCPHPFSSDQRGCVQYHLKSKYISHKTRYR